VVERSHAGAARFRRLARDDDRVAETLVGWHWVAFALLMLTRFVAFIVSSASHALVIFFDDMKSSTALKQKIASIQDEEAFQTLRREHDTLLTRIISRDGAGAVVKSIGDGLLAVFSEPSTAVERAIEIQEALHHHPYLSVRTGMDMGQVRVEADGGVQRDLFGRHVDWAARAESLADGGHIIVTRSVYIDAFGWIPKARVQWKEHRFYIVKENEQAIEVFEAYNGNLMRPMESLHGQKISSSRVPLSPDERRFDRYYFLAGCSVGNRIAMLPLPHGEGDARSLDDFLNALGRIGLQGYSQIAPISYASEKLCSREASVLDQEELRRIIEQYFESIPPSSYQHRSCVRNNLTHGIMVSAATRILPQWQRHLLPQG
jgi:class 3 adenylate cyclase